MTVQGTVKLIEGNPLDPSSSDIFAQTVVLAHGFTPAGDHWRIMGGNHLFNAWWRITDRYELQRNCDHEWSEHMDHPDLKICDHCEEVEC